MKIIAISLCLLMFAPLCFAKETDCRSIDQYLPDCLQMKCETVSKNGVAKQEILGFNKEGKCIHKQYQPNGDIIDCAYSEESRKFLALQISNSKTEPNRKINEAIKNKINYEPDLVEHIFANECSIIKNKKL